MSEPPIDKSEDSEWSVRSLTGLSVTLEAVLLLQATFDELFNDYRDFTESWLPPPEGCLYSDELCALRLAVQRLIPLQDRVQHFYANLGRTLVHEGPACDDLNAQFLRHRPSLPKDVKVIGFDRTRMIEKGTDLIQILQQSLAAITDVEIAVDKILISINGDDEIEDDWDSEPEDSQNKAVLHFWAQVQTDLWDLDRLLAFYTEEIQSLQLARQGTMQSGS